MDSIDKLLTDAKFDICNEIVSKVDINKLNSSERRTLLVASGWAKDNIPTRVEFYNKCLNLLIEERGKEYAEKVLGNLK